jgi:hypothetical protein
MSLSEIELETVHVARMLTTDCGHAEDATHALRVPHDEPVLQRIREVRREQGVSIKRASQLMGKSVEELRAEEEPASDLTLTQLFEWQRLLEVPAADLLVEPHAPLSAPVLRRAQLIRLMKTVQAIMERANQPGVRRLAQTMVNQLIEIMPELDGVTPWNSLDHRAQNQNGRMLEQHYSRIEDDRPREPR